MGAWTATTVESGASSAGARGSVAMLPITLEELVRWSQRLPPGDRALIEAVYDRGLSAKAVSSMCGLPRHRVARQVRRLVARVRSPEFRLALRGGWRWSAQRCAIAEAAFIRGEPMRRIADELGVSLHQVRTEIARLRAVAREMASQQEVADARAR